MLNSRPHSQQIKMRNHHYKLSIVQPKLSQRLCLYRSRRCNTPGSTAVHRRCLGSSTKCKSGGTRQSLGRLAIIARQDALLILRHSQGTPKLIHTLRCTPCANHTQLTTYDETMRKGLQNILNISFTDTQWLQATLPIRLGGLGIRRAESLAIPAFIASAAFTSEIQSNI